MPDEPLLTLQEAAKLFPEGTMSKRTLTHRIKKGIYGVRLRAVFNGRWFTTREWLNQFMSELTARRTGQIERVWVTPVEELMARFQRLCDSKRAGNGRRAKKTEPE